MGPSPTSWILGASKLQGLAVSIAYASSKLGTAKNPFGSAKATRKALRHLVIKHVAFCTRHEYVERLITKKILLQYLYNDHNRIVYNVSLQC